MMRSLLLGALLPTLGWSVDSGPVAVLSIESGAQITVRTLVGGAPCPMRVRLAYVQQTAHPEFAKQKLEQLCPVGSQVRLRSCGQDFALDSSGAVPALLIGQFAAIPDPAQPPVLAPTGEHVLRTIQLEMVRAGWAVASKADGALPANLEEELASALKEAQEHKMGEYSLPADAKAAPSPGQF